MKERLEMGVTWRGGVLTKQKRISKVTGNPRGRKVKSYAKFDKGELPTPQRNYKIVTTLDFHVFGPNQTDQNL